MLLAAVCLHQETEDLFLAVLSLYRCLLILATPDTYKSSYFSAQVGSLATLCHSLFSIWCLLGFLFIVFTLVLSLKKEEAPPNRTMAPDSSMMPFLL